ncbi:uncharacterized protein LOC116258571 isoform X2 [Nymphaea colorata]|nr:uncharacterized protein LOC116258571 isoform X2 [Nymphaea colorata]XP_031491629.1 uncharacterized protein LOC116258571 isoform X2 [Nymphaea colorata]
MGLRTTWFLHMKANQISTTDTERDRGRNVYGARADKCVKFNCNINISKHVAPEPAKKAGTQTEKHIRPTDTEYEIDSSEMDKVDCMHGDQEKKRRKKGAVTGRINMVLACKRKAGTVRCKKFGYLTLMHIGSARKKKNEKLKNQYTSRKRVGRTGNNVKYSNKWHMPEMTTNPPFHRKKRIERATREVQDVAAKHQDIYICSQSSQTKSIYHESKGNCDGQVDCTVSREDGNNSLGPGKCYSSSNVHKKYLEHGSDQFTNLQSSCNIGLQENGIAKVQGVHHQTNINEDQSQNFRHHNSKKIFRHAYIPQNLHSRGELQRESLSSETPETPSSSMSEMVSVSGIIRRYFNSDEVSLTDNQAESSKCARGCPESHTFRCAHLWNQVHGCWEPETPGIQEDQSNRGGIAPLHTEASSHVNEFNQSGQIRETFLEQSERNVAEHAKIRGKHHKGLSCSMLQEAPLASNMDDCKSSQVKNSSKKKKRKKKKREEKKEENVHHQKIQVESQTGDENRVDQPSNCADTSLDAKVNDFMSEPAVGADSRADPPRFPSSSSGHSSPKLKPRRMEVGKRILEAVSSLSTSCRKKSSNLELRSKISGSNSIRKLEFEIL